MSVPFVNGQDVLELGGKGKAVGMVLDKAHNMQLNGVSEKT